MFSEKNRSVPGVTHIGQPKNAMNRPLWVTEESGGYSGRPVQKATAVVAEDEGVQFSVVYRRLEGFGHAVQYILGGDLLFYSLGDHM